MLTNKWETNALLFISTCSVNGLQLILNIFQQHVQEKVIAHKIIDVISIYWNLYT